MIPKIDKITCRQKGNRMPERRRVKRKTFSRSLDFETSAFGSAALLGRGCGVDISSSGLGLLTVCRLEKGTVLRLIFPEYLGNIALPVFAEVTWTSRVTESVRAGLRFM